MAAVGGGETGNYDRQLIIEAVNLLRASSQERARNRRLGYWTANTAAASWQGVGFRFHLRKSSSGTFGLVFELLEGESPSLLQRPTVQLSLLGNPLPKGLRGSLAAAGHLPDVQVLYEVGVVFFHDASGNLMHYVAVQDGFPMRLLLQECQRLVIPINGILLNGSS